MPDADQLDRTQDQVRQQALAQCRVSYERADLAAKIRQARQLLAAADAPNKQIYVITDMQKLSWAGLAEDGEVQCKSPSPGATKWSWRGLG